MTLHVEEKIIINGEKYDLLSRPFEPFLKVLDVKLIPFGSYCWRGYMGEWKIENNVLYLAKIKLRYDPKDEKKITPLKFDDVIFQATWYTGELRVGVGEKVFYHHSYVPMYEKEMLIQVDQGLITNHHFKENEIPDIEDSGLPF